MSTIPKPEDFEGLPHPDLPVNLTKVRRRLSDSFASPDREYTVLHLSVEDPEVVRDKYGDEHGIDVTRSLLIVAQCDRTDGERRISFALIKFDDRLTFPRKLARGPMIELLAQLATRPREFLHSEVFVPAYAVIAGGEL